MRDAAAELSSQGVSIWLDDLSRRSLEDGHLARLVRDRFVTGVTTNPTIFHRAITSSDAYAAELRDLALRRVDVADAILQLTTADVRSAADVLAPVHRRTGGRDGWVSIEVDPRLAQDATKTLAAARALARAVGRANVLVKIPATDGSLPAISDALAEGINVNVTLIFSPARYEEVLDAFLDGLERALAAGRDLSRIASVASVFLSRVDTAVDERLDALGTPAAASLRGTAAVAGARLVFAHHATVMAGPRWSRLAAAGARPQRVLWASTGVKDAAYDDTRYVVELVAEGIVNTMPQSTLEALTDHGVVRGDTLSGTAEAAAAVISDLTALGVDLPALLADLEAAAVEQFTAIWNRLHVAVEAAMIRERGIGQGPARGSGGPRRADRADVPSQASPVDRPAARRRAMFVQVIKGKVSDRAAVKAHLDRWVDELSGGADGWLGSTAGIAADGTFVGVVRFQDAAAARRNSDRPEQGEWWAGMERLIEGEATFQDSERVMVDVQGNPEDAGFVQVMQGGSNDPDRAWKLMEEDDTDWSAFRPDMIGSISIGHPGGDWTMVNYFTSEAEARAGEQKEPTPEMAQMMEELNSLADGPPTYIDITEPIYSSPK